MAKTRTPRTDIETMEQEALVKWFKLAYPNEIMFCIPNQLVRGERHAIAMARSGVVGGIPDLCIPVARKGCHGLFVELKRPQVFGGPKGVVSAKQKAVIHYLISRDYAAIICWGWVDAMEQITEYMG